VFEKGCLAGKVVFVAGGTSGINLATAQRMHDLGASVFVMSRSEERVTAAVAGFADPLRAAGLAGDVRAFEQVEAAVTACRARYGLIDVVVSGAAGNFLARAADLSPRGFRTVIEIDLLGGFHVFKAAYPALRRPGASLINVSALQAFVAMPSQAHACAAKAGLDALVRALALEWGPEGIRVNSIAPGPVNDTEGMQRLAPNDEARTDLTRAIPLGRWADKRDIADLAVFLASEMGANISGAVLVSDGGYLAGRMS